MAETKLIRGMELRPQGTSVTVPSGPLTYNIPIVYYCVCETASNTLQKVATWLGVLENDGTTKNVKAKASNSGDKFRLYEGVTVAVYFTKGCDSLSGTITLRIDDKDAKPIVLNDDSSTDSFGKSKNKFAGCNKGDVMVFVYDGARFKVANGIDSGAISLIKDKVAGLEKWTVKRPGYDPTKAVEKQTGTVAAAGADGTTIVYVDADGVVQESKKDIGSDIQFVYLDKGKIKQTTKTVGGNNQPIWMNGGQMDTLTAVGNTSTPVYVKSDGTITQISGNIGEQGLEHMKPIYVSTTGALTAASVTIGSGLVGATEPQAIWMDSGSLKNIQTTMGTDVKPLKLVNGIFKPVAKALATQEDVGNAAHGVSLGFDTSTDVLSIQLKDQNGNNIGTAATIDLALESLVTNMTYEDGKIVITKKDGGKVNVPVVDLQNGLVKDPGSNGVGSNVKPIFVNTSGEATAINANLGGPNKPVYFEGGQIKVCDFDASQFPTGSPGNGQITIKWNNGTPTDSSASFTVNQKTNATITFNIPSKAAHLEDYNKLIKRSGTSSVGDSTHPVYIDGKGLVQAGATIPSYGTVSTTAAGLAPKAPGGSDKFLRGDGAWATIPASPDTNYYHTGTKTPAATGATTGLKATWDTVGTPGALGITIPIYWGTAVPTMTAVTGALYIKI